MKNFLIAFGIAFGILTIFSLISAAVGTFANWLKREFPTLYAILMIIILLAVTIFIWEVIKR